MGIQYTQFLNNGAPLLLANEKMGPGQFLQSPNGRFRLELQTDGNLVLKDGVVAWIANEGQPYSKTLSRKLVGLPSFFISNSGFLYDPSRRRLWIAESTHTTDKTAWYNNRMSIQDDGNLVIYDNRNGSLCWARFGFVPGRMNARHKLHTVIFQSSEYQIHKFDMF